MVGGPGPRDLFARERPGAFCAVLHILFLGIHGTIGFRQRLARIAACAEGVHAIGDFEGNGRALPFEGELYTIVERA